MARKSKFSASASDVAQATWRVGNYLRISREDGDKEESDSIGSQKDLASFYLKSHPNMTLVDEYVDDGYSGTSFDRPGFKKMFADLTSGRINCVIVKDLSRLGRNYIEVGQYLEMIFPMLNVRFIAINDHIDSEETPDSTGGAMVAFKNVMNDEYCRDISNKVRSVLTTKRKQGKFIGSFASYGYLKDPEDHNHLIVDEESAPVVRDIFHWFLSGMSIIGIAKKLNAQGVLNPSSYKRHKGMNYQHPQHDLNDTMWQSSSVRRILTNRLYAGDMVQGKNKIKSYKLQVSVNVPQKDWIVVENTHEAIVERDTFQKAQEILSRDQRTSPGKNRYYVLSGYIRCADCKRAMNRKLISQPYAEYCYYICSTFKKMNRDACTKHTIRSDKLEKAVLETLKAHIQLAVSLDEIMRGLKEQNVKSKSSDRLEASLSAKKQEIAFLENCKMELYPDWKNGVLTKEEYTAMKSRFDAQIEGLQKEIQAIQTEIEAYQNVATEENAFLTYFLAHKNIETLTREVVVELIEMIYVHEGGEITIQFKYQNEYERLLDLLKEKGIALSPAGKVS